MEFLILVTVFLLLLYFYNKGKEDKPIQKSNNKPLKYESFDRPTEIVRHEIPNEFKKMFTDEDYDAARAYLQQIAYGMLDKNIPKSEKILFKAMMTYFADHDPLYKTMIQELYNIIKSNEGCIQSKIYNELPKYDTETIRYILYFGHELEDIYRVKSGRSYQLYTSKNKSVLNDKQIENKKTSTIYENNKIKVTLETESYFDDAYEEGNTYIKRLGKRIKADEAFFASSSNDLTRMIKATKIKTNPIDRHYLLQAIIQKTYSNRKMSDKDKELCSKISQIHIDEIDTIIPALKKEFNELPRIMTFQYYATILTEAQKYQEAIAVCKKAIEYKLHDGTQSGFDGRIKRIMKKIK